MLLLKDSNRWPKSFSAHFSEYLLLDLRKQVLSYWCPPWTIAVPQEQHLIPRGCSLSASTTLSPSPVLNHLLLTTTWWSQVLWSPFSDEIDIQKLSALLRVIQLLRESQNLNPGKDSRVHGFSQPLHYYGTIFCFLSATLWQSLICM